MVGTYLTDISETKTAALMYLLSIFCNEHARLPESGFARFCARTGRMEDLVAALELAQADEDDCQKWAISSEQWFVGVKQALYLRLVEALHSESAQVDDFVIPNTAGCIKAGQC